MDVVDKITRRPDGQTGPFTRIQTITIQEA
jgi:hypothetical protein